MSADAVAAPIVVVAVDLLAEARIADVTDACRRTAARVALWGKRHPVSGRGAAVVVGGLRGAERRIPSSLLAFATRIVPSPPILLVCEDELVRPSISLYDGRVTLLGGSGDRDAIYSRLRVLLAARAPSEVPSTRERARSAWWAAEAGELGVAALVEEEHGALRVDAVVDNAAATVRFLPTEREWQVEWPAVPGTLFMLSPRRLPVASDLSATHGGKGLARVRASSGDVVIALSPPAAGSDRDPRALKLPITAGGPSVLDAVRATIAPNGGGWATVVEVR